MWPGICTRVVGVAVSNSWVLRHDVVVPTSTRERYEGVSEYITGIGVFALALSPLSVPIVVTIIDAVRRRLSRRAPAAAVPFGSELGDFRLYAVQTP
jgi:hypothetical protein